MADEASALTSVVRLGGSAKTANRFGLHDMHGNVWEWVQDCYEDYNPARTDAAPVQPEATQDCSRVLRGCSWNFNPQGLRSAYRGRYTPAGRSNDFGFRLARTVLPPES